MASSIEWLNGGETWNPIKARRKKDGKKGWACVRISPGCEHCYSEAQNVQCGANRTRHGTGLKYNVPSLDQVELYLDEEVLMQPLHWKKPRLIFPCSMTDWMADFVPDGWRDKMLAVMALTPQHTYLTLTKRADWQRYYFTDESLRMAHGQMVRNRLESVAWTTNKYFPEYADKEIALPLPNLWLGTSTESQPYADKRIPLLLQTPAAVRWISAEPLLSGLNIVRYLGHRTFRCKCGFHDTERELTFMGGDVYYCQTCGDKCEILPSLDWVVPGFESGPKARPGHPDWARSLRDQCQASGTPFFWKQWGEWVPPDQFSSDGWDDVEMNARGVTIYPDGRVTDAYGSTSDGSERVWRIGKKTAGRLLDGKEHSEYPEAAHAGA